MTRIGVLTSGGDAPGMNACIRAIVRTGIFNGCKVIGIHRGYTGLLNQELSEMSLRSVSNTIQQGGTILKTSRCPEFLEPQGRAKAGRILRAHNIDGLIIIGGDGSFQGAHLLYLEENIPVIGVPGTIDNDLYGTDFTIGYDTAVNTALESIDKIRDTAASHDRLFLVEVMGRRSGFIGIEVGIAGGAEEILIPETPTDVNALCQRIVENIRKGKTSNIIVVAEGNAAGSAIELGEKIKNQIGLDYRVCILGHIQRGGSPSARDRVLATKLGYAAVNALLEGKTDVMVGEINNQLCYTPLEATWTKKKPVDQELLKLVRITAL
ncbi:MAG: 6-phosphofructokinase [candidate division KSB1 bacterium]|nr:6-phosphofructokinase [candidate division KSB1 bacterium]